MRRLGMEGDVSGKTALASALVVVLICVLGAGVATASVSGQGAPAPSIYAGKVYMNNQPMPDGVEIYAKVNGVRTGRALSADGNYSGLAVSSPEGAVGGQLTFWASRGFGEVQAQEVLPFTPPAVFAEARSLDLHFPTVPGNFQTPAAQTPTPTPALPIPGEPLVPTLVALALAAGAALLIGGALALRATHARRA